MANAKYWAKTIGLWALQILLAVMFFMVGLSKFSDGGWIERFTNWGYPDNVVYIIGALEVLGALGVLIPRLAAYAAGGLILIMIGAVLTHLVHGEAPWPLLHIALLSLILYARRPAFLRKNILNPDPTPDPSA